MITIKNKNGTDLVSVPLTKSSKRKYTLMTEDFITLCFSLQNPVDFKLGSYVDFEEGLFEVTFKQNPTLNKNTGGYDYELQLDAYYWKWVNKIFKFTPEVGGQEASWSLTAPLEVHLEILLRNLKKLNYTYRSTDFSFFIHGNVVDKPLSLTYNNVNILDALSMMSEAAECEWWVTDSIIHLGKCEQGTLVDFEIDKNVAEMSSSENGNTFATRLFVFGSTKNLPPNYRPVDESLVVNGSVQRRLMLPIGTPYIDAAPGLTEEEAIEAIVVLEDIYPRMEGSIAEVFTYQHSVENEDGTTHTETFYRFKDPSFTFKKEYILEAQELGVRFTSGKLNGMDFGVAFNPDGLNEVIYAPGGGGTDGFLNPIPNPDCQVFEIVVNEKYGRKLPDETLHPEVGDTYILYGWDSTKISELGLVDKAEKELLAEGLKLSNKFKVDPTTYDCVMMSDYMFGLNESGGLDSSYRRVFSIGDRVNLKNPAFFENGRQSRIIGLEYYLDIPYSHTVYTVGESTSYSRLGDIESQLQSLVYKGQTYSGVGGISFYVIGTNDSTVPTNQNVYSALRSDRRFLRKDVDDKSKGSVSSEKGFFVGDFQSGSMGSGAALYQDTDKNTYGEVDFLKVRKKAIFTNITIQELKAVGGELILSPATMTCSEVEETSEGYKCFFITEDPDGNTIYNQFELDDLARCQTFNVSDSTYYWRRVVGLGTNYIVLSKSDCDTGSDAPKAGDNICSLGNKSKEDRQSAIVLSAYGPDAPSFKQYAGINSFSLEGKQVTKISSNVNELKGKLTIEPGSIGAENLTDLPEEIFKAVDIGSVNLLRNTSFTGDFLTLNIEDTSPLDGDSSTFSNPLIFWKGFADIIDDSNATFGKSAILGSLIQYVDLLKGENYVLSFKAKGSSIRVILGNELKTIPLSSNYNKFSINFISDGVGSFAVSGDATVCDIKLERGTISTSWTPNPNDNDSAFAEFQSTNYIAESIKNGSTNIFGGLILSTILKLGNYVDGSLKQVNAGVSGIYNDFNDVAFWGGGTLEQAIRTVIKFKENPMYNPSETEWLNLAKFVVTHGGDVFLRGYIHALGGFFRGDIQAERGIFKNITTPNGNFQIDSEGNAILADANIKGKIEADEDSLFKGAVSIANGNILLNPDGSGKLASGFISWTSSGAITINSALINNATVTGKFTASQGLFLNPAVILTSGTYREFRTIDLNSYTSNLFFIQKNSQDNVISNTVQTRIILPSLNKLNLLFIIIDEQISCNVGFRSYNQTEDCFDWYTIGKNSFILLRKQQSNSFCPWTIF